MPTKASNCSADENGGLGGDDAWPGPWPPSYPTGGDAALTDEGSAYHPGCLHEKVTGGHEDGSGAAGHLPESCTSQRSLCYQVGFSTASGPPPPSPAHTRCNLSALLHRDDGRGGGEHVDNITRG